MKKLVEQKQLLNGYTISLAWEIACLEYNDPNLNYSKPIDDFLYSDGEPSLPNYINLILDALNNGALSGDSRLTYFLTKTILTNNPIDSCITGYMEKIPSHLQQYLKKTPIEAALINCIFRRIDKKESRKKRDSITFNNEKLKTYYDSKHPIYDTCPDKKHKDMAIAMLELLDLCQNVLSDRGTLIEEDKKSAAIVYRDIELANDFDAKSQQIWSLDKVKCGVAVDSHLYTLFQFSGLIEPNKRPVNAEFFSDIITQKSNLKRQDRKLHNYELETIKKINQFLKTCLGHHEVSEPIDVCRHVYSALQQAAQKPAPS